MSRRAPGTIARDSWGKGWTGGIGFGLAVWVLVLPALWFGGAAQFAVAQTPAWTAAGVGPRVSVMEIPLSIDLRPLFLRADELLPREVGHWKGWRKQQGIETRYRAWRGPLRMALVGDLLQVEAHMRYWIRGRKQILGGFSLDVGCGVDEPPRQAVVGLQVRLAWGVDWTLRSQVRVLPTHFIDRCEVTAADIDVSPILDRLFRGRMEESLLAALSELRPRLDAVRAQAAHYWAALQEPVELTSGFWLSVDPLALALAPPWGQGDQLQTSLGLVLLLGLGAEPVAAATPRPLPPLQTYIPRGAGMRFELAADVDLEGLGDHLSGLLADTQFTMEGHRIAIRSIDLRGEGSDLVFTALLGGEAPGSIEIRAQPAFDPEAQKLRLRDLDFVFDPQDPEQALVVNLFYQRIQKALQDGANRLLAERTDGMREGLESALSRAFPQDLTLDLSSLHLSELDFAVSGSSVRLRGTATGSLTVQAQ